MLVGWFNAVKVESVPLKSSEFCRPLTSALFERMIDQWATSRRSDTTGSRYATRFG
jgi:hypothetical protein